MDNNVDKEKYELKMEKDNHRLLVHTYHFLETKYTFLEFIVYYL